MWQMTPESSFGYFVSLVTMFGLLTWISILVSHIYFVRARRAQGINEADMAYVAPLGLYGSYFALVFCIIIAIFSNFGVFVHVKTRKNLDFDYKTFITGYLGIPLYLIMIAGYKVIMKRKGRTSLDADVYEGKDVIDKEEAEFLAWKQERKELRQGSWWYRRFVAWLF